MVMVLPRQTGLLRSSLEEQKSVVLVIRQHKNPSVNDVTPQDSSEEDAIRSSNRNCKETFMKSEKTCYIC